MVDFRTVSADGILTHRATRWYNRFPTSDGPPTTSPLTTFAVAIATTRRIHVMSKRNCGLAVAVLLTACGSSGEKSVAGKIVRDSAGVSIVEHSAEYIAALPEFTIDTATPLRHVRGDEPDAQFTTIGDAEQRSDGGFYVAETASGDIKAFAADGKFERLMARRGKGPGEVGFVLRLQVLADDSLAYFDVNHRRVSVIAPNGTFARQLLFPRFDDGSNVRISTQMADGRLLGTHRRPFVPATANPDSTYRNPYGLVLYRVIPGTESAPPSAQVDTIAVVLDGEAYRANTTLGGETYPDEYPLRLGPTTVFATNGRHTFVATNESAEIVEYNNKTMVRRIRSGSAPEPITEANRTTVTDDAIRAMEKIPAAAPQLPEIRAMMKTWRFAKFWPYAQRVYTGADGTVWAQKPVLLENDARQYFVFDSTGSALAHVTLPPRFNVLRVNMREILGVQKDADDVPHLMLWKVVPKPK